MSQQITITAYSTALFSKRGSSSISGSCFFRCRRRRLCRAPCRRRGRIHTIAVTHADRDRSGGPAPTTATQCPAAACRQPLSTPPTAALSAALAAPLRSKFNPHTENPPGDLEGDATGRRRATRPQMRSSKPPVVTHLTDTGNQVKSLSYFVVREFRSLKPEYVGPRPGRLETECDRSTGPTSSRR